MPSSAAILQLLGLTALASALALAGNCYARPADERWSLRGLALGLALTPTALALLTCATFALSSWALPGALLYVGVPIAVATAVLVALRGDGIDARSSAPWTRLEIVVACICAAAFIPFLASVLANVASLQTDHDFSVYLNEAALLARTMQQGLPGPLDWMDFRHPDVTYPHSLTFTAYLAFGFLGLDAPGFGADFLPRLLVGLDHVAVVLAAFAIAPAGPGRAASLVGALAAALVLIEPVWAYELRAFSRDTFYLAPLLVAIALLLDAAPANKARDRDRGRPAGLALLGVAVLGAGLGHSLGIVYLAAAVAAVGLLKLAHYGWAVFRVTELWVAALGLALTAGKTALRFLGNEAGNLGFAYPFYNDPALRAALDSQRDFFEAVPLTAFASKLGAMHGISLPIWIVLLLSVVALAMAIRKRRLEASGETLLALLCIILASAGLIVAPTIKMDGIALASAFVSNPRYGFPLGLLILIAAALGLALLARTGTPLLARWSEAERSAKAIAGAATLAVALAAGWNGLHLLHKALTTNEHSKALNDRDICRRLEDAGARVIYVDDDGMLYRCGARSAYLFTARGADVLGAESAEDFTRKLDAEKVDAIVLKRPIKVWWQETRLYRHLTDTWVQDTSSRGPTIFKRPALAAGAATP